MKSPHCSLGEGGGNGWAPRGKGNCFFHRKKEYLISRHPARENQTVAPPWEWKKGGGRKLAASFNKKKGEKRFFAKGGTSLQLDRRKKRRVNGPNTGGKKGGYLTIKKKQLA